MELETQPGAAQKKRRGDLQHYSGELGLEGREREAAGMEVAQCWAEAVGWVGEGRHEPWPAL